MSIDACIFFKADQDFTEQDLEWSLPEYTSIVPVTNEFLNYPNLLEANYTIIGLGSFYELHYENGNWPCLAYILMLLFQCDKVEKVWYGGDSGNFKIKLISEEDVTYLTSYFMKFGSKPYKEKCKE